MNPNIPYRYLIDPEETRTLLADFAGQEIIGLDTETFYDFRTQENRLSLLQLAAPNGAVVVVDALAAGIEAARDLIENPQIVLAAHNARFDDGILRGSGFEPAGFVYTLRLARRTLRLQSYGLASVADHLFGMTLDKSHQRSDWRKRPLSRAQLDYAALDAQAALQVFQTLTDRLKSQGRLESELKRARLKRKGEEEEPKPTAKPRGPELRPLTGEERIIYERLSTWREVEAKRARLPLYMICYDKTLEQLAITRPRTLADLDPIYGLGPARIAKYGEQLLACLS
ncbi:MAG: HRDC domain-containing protein [Acidobacteria bacterium]|nr:HRDC domain-containing protein [Acidobacteriota bacterium]